MVKALVVVDGEPTQILEEKFGENEGFTWNKNTEAIAAIGEQAEDATVYKGKVQSEGMGFRGNGYVSLDKIKGAFVAWYQENDGGASTVNVTIRYSLKIDSAAGTYIRVHLNETSIKDKIFLPNTNGWGNSWSEITVPLQITSGANTIKLETLENEGLYLDEILID